MIRIISSIEWHRTQAELESLHNDVRRLEAALAQERRISAGRLAAIEEAQNAYLDVDWRWRSAELKIDELNRRIDALSTVRMPVVRVWEN